MKPSTFHIFNASAGSGKTFTLVKEYLTALFQSTSNFPFSTILAITFTNKAVGEMKERIVEALKSFSSESILENPSDLFLQLCADLNTDPISLQKWAAEMLQNIVHNYASFEVSTIDKFNQKLIRTFAFDLSLPLNFQVELDTNEILSQAVDNLIAKAGIEKELTTLLIDFAKEKISDDRSWDVAYDFNQIASLLTNENHFEMLDSLKDKTLKDYVQLKNKLKKERSEIEKIIRESAQIALETIENHGLEFTDFSGSYLPKHFQNLAEGNFDIKFGNKWQEDLENSTLYPKRVPEDLAEIIDSIQPELAQLFNATKALVLRSKLYDAVLKNITSLSVLNAIIKEVSAIKEEKNIVLISEFNTIVSDHIKIQPAPFIYERIGEKFKHFFIDEFQDTSVLQWENLIPLIENALSGSNSSAMLVGDAKQAIYRWRGGRAEQFISLHNLISNPFQIEPKLEPLLKNYRSHKDIVQFNNSFFKHVSTFAFSNESYQNLYANSGQEVHIKDEGYVNLKFLEFPVDNNKDELYPEHVLNTITNCLSNGFEEKDIAILVRSHKHGVAITDYLNANSSVNIISSETLLLSRSKEVKLIVNVLQLLDQPKNKTLKFEICTYLLGQKIKEEDHYSFISMLLDSNLHDFFNGFHRYGISFDAREFIQLPLYEGVELIVNAFGLVDVSNGYVQYFLDFVLDYCLSNGTSLSDFLDYYDSRKDKLSVTIPDGINAVKIMTIHKSKGLEFPVVIFPYAEIDIYREQKPKVWLPVDPNSFGGFDHLLINYNSEMASYNIESAQLHLEHTAELELDAINLLYVVLTRAVEQLHIISRLKLDGRGQESLKSFDGLFINYLKHQDLWEDGKQIYEFGNSERSFHRDLIVEAATQQKSFITTPKKELNIKIVTNAGYLWDTEQQKAIERGNLIHLIMSYVKTKIDIPFVLSKLQTESVLNRGQAEELLPIVDAIISHPTLSKYFDSELTVYNERDIILNNGEIQRPDRVTIDANNRATVLDYKTGSQGESHEVQIMAYMKALKELGFNVEKGILVYINEAIEIKEVLTL